MPMDEIAKAATEVSLTGEENKPGKFELPGTQDTTGKAAAGPELANSQEIRDKLSDVPANFESTKQFEQIRKVPESSVSGLEEKNPENPPIQNKIDGERREEEVESELVKKYPESEGYSIKGEVYLYDKDGKIAQDPVTGEGRRIDFVVVDKNGNVVDSIEVTSQTADKADQSAKEQRIRESGGNYIKMSDGIFVKIPDDVQTKIERRD